MRPFPRNVFTHYALVVLVLVLVEVVVGISKDIWLYQWIENLTLI